MKEKEKKLFFSLCNFVSPDPDKIEKLIDRGAATPELLGYLFTNRMAGVGYGMLEKHHMLEKLDREFRTSLKLAWNLNRRVNDDFFGCLKYLSAQLDACDVPYALLKGAYLCGKYPLGYRTANDIDILIRPEDISKVATKLKLAGFRQGYVINDRYVEATRQQIIESKMMRGETVPFIREIKLPYIRLLEADINFSLDYKNSNDNTVRDMLERAKTVTVGNTTIRTLAPDDFFLHLCSHLYKEATTLPWIKTKRDMTFYKYTDIYMLLNEMNDEVQTAVMAKAKALGLEKELHYCLESIQTLFNLPSTGILLSSFEKEKNFLHEVIAPMEKKIYTYTEQNISKRFFCENRLKLLKEKSGEALNNDTP